MISPLMLAGLLQVCAVTPPPLTSSQATLLAQAQVGVTLIESGVDSWAIHDNNTGQSYYPASYESAVAIDTLLIQNDEAIGGRGIDTGIGQVNSHNFAAHHLTPASALHPCDNLAVSSEMLSSTFAAELNRFRNYPEQYREYAALDATLQTYNSGSANGNPRYTRDVLTAMRGSYAYATLAALGVRDGMASSAGAGNARGGRAANLSAAWIFVPAATTRAKAQGARAPLPTDSFASDSASPNTSDVFHK